MIKSLSADKRGIGTGDSKLNFRLLIKEKFSEPALESYEANNLTFELNSQLGFGTYLYTIESISRITKETVEELVYGFFEIYADIIEITPEDTTVEIFKPPAV